MASQLFLKKVITKHGSASGKKLITYMWYVLMKKSLYLLLSHLIWINVTSR